MEWLIHYIIDWQISPWLILQLIFKMADCKKSLVEPIKQEQVTSAFLHVQKKAVMSQSFASLSFNRQQVNCENSVATAKHSTYEHFATTVHVYIQMPIMLPLQCMSTFDRRPPLAARCRPGSKAKYWRHSEKKQYFLTRRMFISRWN